MGRLVGPAVSRAGSLPMPSRSPSSMLIPPTIKASIGPPHAFTGQELVDLFTPVVVLPLAWLVLSAAGGSDRRTTLIFVAIAGLWAGAQGIHLAANAIGDAFTAGPARDAFYATEAGNLDHFLDEDLGHWAWHLAWASLSILFLGRGLAAPGAMFSERGRSPIASDRRGGPRDHVRDRHGRRRHDRARDPAGRRPPRCGGGRSEPESAASAHPVSGRFVRDHACRVRGLGRDQRGSARRAMPRHRVLSSGRAALMIDGSELCDRHAAS